MKPGRIIGFIISCVILLIGIFTEYAGRSTYLIWMGAIFLVLDIIGAIKDKLDSQTPNLQDKDVSNTPPPMYVVEEYTDESAENEQTDYSVSLMQDADYYDTIAQYLNVVVCFCENHEGDGNTIIPMLRELALEYAGKIKIGVYDVLAEGCTRVKEDNEISTIPTFMFYQNGMEVRKKTGFIRKEELRSWFDQLSE